MGNGVAPPGHGLDERDAVVFGETQSVSKRADRVRVGAFPFATLQGAHGFGGEAGPRGKLLLRKTCGLAQSPQSRPERGVVFSAHALLPSLLHAPRRRWST